MPTYVYECAEPSAGCARCREGLEIMHGLGEPPPTACPHCGAALRRRFTPPGLNLRYNEKATLSDANLKRHGFKRIHNEGDGRFRIT